MVKVTLVDETGLAQYNTLKEKGFYNNIMGTSAVFSIFCDSIKNIITYKGKNVCPDCIKKLKAQV